MACRILTNQCAGICNTQLLCPEFVTLLNESLKEHEIPTLGDPLENMTGQSKEQQQSLTDQSETRSFRVFQHVIPQLQFASQSDHFHL